LRFIQELSWLLSSYEDLDFKALGALTDQLTIVQRANSNLRTHSANRAPTVQLLVGIVPSLLTDDRLFPTNEDVIEFSRLALGITIPRWHKKSKYELIGHIVCSTEHADPKRLQRLVNALGDLMDDKGETRRALEVQRQSGLSWNEVIQKLLSRDHEQT
jgi:hypothetical protein